MSYPEFKKSECCDALLHIESCSPLPNYDQWYYIEQERCAICGKIQEPRPGLKFNGTKPIFYESSYVFALFIPTPDGEKQIGL